MGTARRSQVTTHLYHTILYRPQHTVATDISLNQLCPSRSAPLQSPQLPNVPLEHLSFVQHHVFPQRPQWHFLHSRSGRKRFLLHLVPHRRSRQAQLPAWQSARQDGEVWRWRVEVWRENRNREREG